MIGTKYLKINMTEKFQIVGNAIPPPPPPPPPLLWRSMLYNLFSVHYCETLNVITICNI